MRTRSFIVFMCVMAACFTALRTFGQESDEPELEPIPRDQRDLALEALQSTEDPAFEQFVARETLVAALTRLDTELMADCALQLAEGERVLLRQHRSGVTPQVVLECAATSASAFARQEGLERLETAAKNLGLDDLATRFGVAKQMAAASRGRARKLRISYSQLFPMPKSVLENIKKDEYPSYIKKTANGLRIDDRYKFVIWGDLALVINAVLATPEETPNYQTFFSKWGEFETSNGNKYVTYCSCGSNRMYSSGDHCQHGKDANGQPTCAGYCAGDNEGKACSFTTVMYPPIGTGTAQVVGY